MGSASNNVVMRWHMSAYPETGQRSPLPGILMAAAVLVAGADAGSEPAGGHLEKATAALGEAGRFATKIAAKGAIWLAVHHGSDVSERSAPAEEDQETTSEGPLVVRFAHGVGSIIVVPARRPHKHGHGSGERN
jgi:hypothetical protein